MPFFTAEDRAERQLGVQKRLAQKQARKATQLRAIEEAAKFLLTQALEQIRQDYRNGERHSKFIFEQNDHPSIAEAGCKDVAIRLLQLIREHTGLLGGDTYETEGPAGHVWINL